MENLKYTPFYSIHQSLKAKILPFAGYYMPIEYSGITDEHLTVRQHVGVFDVSHMGEIWVKGRNALSFLQWVTSNDVSKLYDGKVQYSCLPNGKGGIVDDILVYRFNEELYLLVVNAANIDKDWNWLNSQNKFQALLENKSEETAQLAIQGPASTEVLQQLTDINLSVLKYYTFTTAELAGIKNVIISNTGYTGAGGYEIYFHPTYAEIIWNKIFEAGAKYGIKPIGLGARDTLRLEMGYCLYGNDIDDTTSPIEAGLGWITKFTDYKNFIDKEILWKQQQEGVKRKLIGFRMIDKGIPRHNYSIKNQEGENIGIVTSGSISPVLKEGIGLGYVKPIYSIPDTEIYVEIRSKLLKAKVVQTPFLKAGV